MPTIEDGAEFLLEDAEAWNALVLSRGCIIEALLPNGVLGEEVDVWGGFLVMESRLNSADSSWLLDVKSLGCSSPEVTRELSGFFNRKPGRLHLCTDSFCTLDSDGVLHVQRLRTYSVEGFHRSYLTHYLRGQMKKWLKEAGLLADDDQEEVEPPVIGERARGRGKEAPKASPKVAGGAPKTKLKEPATEPKRRRPAKEEEEERREALRRRLRAARDKMSLGAGGSAAPRESAVHGDAALEIEEADTLSIASSSPGYSASVLDENLATGTLMQPLGRGPQRVANAPHVPGSAGPAVKKKKKKKRQKAAKEKTEGIDNLQLVATSGGTTNSLQKQLLQRAAETSQLQLLKRKQSHKKNSLAAAGKALVQILTKSGKDGKHSKEESKKKRRRRKRKIKREGGGDPNSPSGSSPTSSGDDGSGTYSEESSEESVGDQMEAPLRKKSKRRPGSVLQLLVAHARQQLDQTAKVEVAPEGTDPTTGVKLASYFNICIRPQLGQAMTQIREMHHLSNTMDCLRRGDLGLVGDLLASRFISLHQSVLDGSWQAARHLEILPMEEVSAAGQSIVLKARKHARLTAKALGQDTGWNWRNPQKGKGGKGRGGFWNEQEWQQPQKGKVKGGKGRGKGKGWWDASQGAPNVDTNKTKEKPGEKGT